MPEQDGTLAGTLKGRGIEDLPSRRETDKGVSVEVRLVTQISGIALLVWCLCLLLQLFALMVELIKTYFKYLQDQEGGKDTIDGQLVDNRIFVGPRILKTLFFWCSFKYTILLNPHYWMSLYFMMQ